MADERSTKKLRELEPDVQERVRKALREQK